MVPEAALEALDELGGRVADLRDKIMAVRRSAVDAMVVLDRSQMRDILVRASTLGLSLPRERTMREILDLPEEEFLQVKLKSGLKMENTRMVVSATMGIKKEYLDRMALRGEVGLPCCGSSRLFPPEN